MGQVLRTKEQAVSQNPGTARLAFLKTLQPQAQHSTPNEQKDSRGGKQRHHSGVSALLTIFSIEVLQALHKVANKNSRGHAKLLSSNCAKFLRLAISLLSAGGYWPHTSLAACRELWQAQCQPHRERTTDS